METEITNFGEAESRIELCKQNNSKSLDLMGLGLIPSELLGLIPSINGIHNLEQLDLSKNKMDILPDQIVVALGEKRLKTFNLSGNGLTHLPRNIKNIKSLENLDLSKNLLKNLPGSIVRLASLKGLNVEDNKLSVIPEGMAGLQNLERLNVANNNIKTMPDEIAEMISLRSLVLSGNGILYLPDDIGNLKKLSTIDLSNNELKSLPRSFSKLKNLEHLNVNSNKLTSVIVSIPISGKLEHIDLSHNRILILPFEMEDLKNLKILKVSNNRLDRVQPEIFRGWSNLEQLNLSGNNLNENSLPAKMDKMVNLTHLEISSNKFESLPKQILDLTKLRVLEATHNKIDSLPDTTGVFSRLKISRLTGNTRKDIPTGIGKLKNLEVLKLTSNRIKSLPKEIKNCSNLKSLHLEYNRLRELPTQIGDLTKLTHLALTRNYLQDLPVEVKKLKELERLEIGNNIMKPNEINKIRDYHQRDILGLIDPAMSGQEDKYQFGVIASLFKEKAGDLPERFSGLDAGSFKDYHKNTLTTKEVLGNFMEAIPVGPNAPALYTVPAKAIINELITNKHTRKDLLQQMAVAVGDCATPVKDFLIQKAVGIEKDNPGTFPQFEALVTREGVEAMINQRLDDLLTTGGEKIEQVQGLVNSIFLKGAEDDPKNTVPITGERERLTSKSVNIEFGYKKVNIELEEEFVKLFCQAGADGRVLQRAGKYFLDPFILMECKEKYCSHNLGMVTQRERRVGDLGKAMQEKLQEHHDIASRYDEPDVSRILNIPQLKNELRSLLIKVEDGQVDNEYKKFLNANKSEVEGLSKISPKKPGQEPSWGISHRSMATPSNHPTPGNRGGRHAESRRRSNSPSNRGIRR